MNDSVTDKLNDAVRVLNENYSKVYFLNDPSKDVRFFTEVDQYISYHKITCYSGGYYFSTLLTFGSLTKLNSNQTTQFLLKIIKSKLTPKSNLVRLIYEGETNV